MSLSNEDFDLENQINHFFNNEPDENKLEIVGDILNFINKFSMFQDIKPFMGSLYRCITHTLEIKPDSIYDFEDLLTKNAIMHFIQEHINYSNITQKDRVLGFLTDSLEKLETQPLITNLGLLIKPMYKDQNYLKGLKHTEEIEVSYEITNDSEIQVKTEVDSWLKGQNINLDNQEEFKSKLFGKLDSLFLKYSIPKTSEESKKINLEALEMFNLKLTMLSLMDQI
ncbi:MAG: hypothetical protein ACXAAH_06480, partial [Promethearchaeota archaeon]